MALHNPGAVKKKNRGVLRMSASQLHDFASTKRKGLPKQKVTMGDLMSRE